VSLGEYSFLPWLRRGIANQIEIAATATSRASITVGVRVRSDVKTADVPPHSVRLVGPGDIVGMNSRMVVKTEPRDGVANFEPNYLAYVDFYDEDFAWRYTPDKPDAGQHRLTPWITLLVLKGEEFRPLRRADQPLPAIELTAGANLASIVPPATQLWAWAHVHLNASLGAGHTPNLDVLATLLRREPDRGYCRLLSPRHLEPNTQYHAFVVPTFAVGRAAGLGEKVLDTDPGLAIAWATQRIFPVYHQWSFATGAAGDFETLVRALVPRDLDRRIGIRDMDVQQPGFGLPPTTGQPDDIVGLEGVLLAPTTVPVPVDPACDLPANLRDQVNLPDDVQTTGLADDTDDPLISAPLYGRWHALVQRVQSFPEHVNWINELNTDPRYRAVAGMGTKVIQKNQEDYMKLAWEQIGDIVSMNRRIHLLQLSVKASDALHARNLTTLSPVQGLATAGPVLRKIMGSPVTVHRLVEQSRLPRAALSGAMRKQLRPRGQLMRRAMPRGSAATALSGTVWRLNAGILSAAPPLPPPEGTTYEATLASAAPRVPGWLRFVAKHRGLLLAIVLALLGLLALVGGSLAFLVVALVGAAAAVAAYGALGPLARRLATVEVLQAAALTPEAVEALPPNDAFVLPAPGAPVVSQPAGGGPDSAQGAAFRQAAIEFNALLADRATAPAPRPSLALDAVHATVMTALEPARAVVRRYSPTMLVGGARLADYVGAYHDAPAATPESRLVPVMAYPDIKLAMYRPLKELQKDDFVPNLHLVPPNTISLMLTNPPVIEAYMVGLNHEFARELLWREYPTDQRPSTFRQFWDPVSSVDTEGLSPEAFAEKVRDIRKIHEWPLETTLGQHNNRLPNDDKPRIVLIIRGDLLKRYPNTIIYAQTARWGDPPDHANHLLLYDQTGEKADLDSRDPNFRFPMFKAQVEPDLHFIGFDLTLDDARGDPSLEETAEARARVAPNRLGWFFVLQEVVGEPRFGLDEQAVTGSEDPLKWDNLSWENLGAAVSVIDVAKPFASNPPGNTDGGVHWGSHAADMAFILFQRPVMVAIHARDMLRNLTHA
jgi:hypothetical protein